MKFLVRLTFADNTVENVLVGPSGQLSDEMRLAANQAAQLAMNTYFEKQAALGNTRLLRTAEVFPVHSEVTDAPDG